MRADIKLLGKNGTKLEYSVTHGILSHSIL
jgi:hypothetical protein